MTTNRTESSSTGHDFGIEASPGQPFFTVFTPAFNRRELLGRVYESLKQQEFRDFDWLIVDDGSTDGTREFIECLIRSDPPFRIRYLYQANGGKHAAHNAAIEAASGFALVVVDSDDWLKPSALQVLKEEWDGLPYQDRFVGVFGLFAYEDGAIVGDRFPEDSFVSNSIDLRYHRKVTGDKIGFNRVDVLRRFPFPDDLPRAYVPESLIWNRIAQEFDSLFINQVIGIKEYQEGGITDASALNHYRNPKGCFIHAVELLNGRVPIPFSGTVRSVINTTKCSFYAKISPFKFKHLRHNLLVILLSPVAAAAVVRDQTRLARRRKGRVAGGAIQA